MSITLEKVVITIDKSRTAEEALLWLVLKNKGNFDKLLLLVNNPAVDYDINYLENGTIKDQGTDELVIDVVLVELFRQLSEMMNEMFKLYTKQDPYIKKGFMEVFEDILSFGIKIQASGVQDEYSKATTVLFTRFLNQGYIIRQTPKRGRDNPEDIKKTKPKTESETESIKTKISDIYKKRGSEIKEILSRIKKRDKLLKSSNPYGVAELKEENNELSQELEQSKQTLEKTKKEEEEKIQIIKTNYDKEIEKIKNTTTQIPTEELNFRDGIILFNELTPVIYNTRKTKEDAIDMLFVNKSNKDTIRLLMESSVELKGVFEVYRVNKNKERKEDENNELLGYMILYALFRQLKTFAKSQDPYILNTVSKEVCLDILKSVQKPTEMIQDNIKSNALMVVDTMFDYLVTKGLIKQPQEKDEPPDEMEQIQAKISSGNFEIINRIRKRYAMITSSNRYTTTGLDMLLQKHSNTATENATKDFDVFYTVTKNAFKQFKRDPLNYAKEYNEKFPCVIMYERSDSYALGRGKYQIGYNYLITKLNVNAPYVVNQNNPIHTEMFLMVHDEYKRLFSKDASNPTIRPHIEAFVYINYQALSIFDIDRELMEIPKYSNIHQKYARLKDLVERETPFKQETSPHILGTTNTILADFYDELDDIIVKTPKNKQKELLVDPSALVNIEKFGISQSDSIQEEETPTKLPEIPVEKPTIIQKNIVRDYRDPYRYHQLIMEDLINLVLLHALVQEYMTRTKMNRDVSEISDILSGLNVGFAKDSPLGLIAKIFDRYTRAYSYVAYNLVQYIIPELLVLPDPETIKTFAKSTETQHFYTSDFVFNK